MQVSAWSQYNIWFQVSRMRLRLGFNSYTRRQECVLLHAQIHANRDNYQRIPFSSIHVIKLGVTLMIFNQSVHFTIESLVTAECQREATPFLCLYQFPLCSCHDQQLVLPTKEECESISTTACQAEFNLALRLGFGYLLPDCDLLPSSRINTTCEHIACHAHSCACTCN